MSKKKKITIAILSVCLVAAIAIGATLAFLTDTDKATNTFTVGDLDITLTEPNWTDTDDGKDMVPGDSLVKDPTVTELKHDSYTRIVMTVTDKDDNVITDTERLALIIKTIRFDSTYDATTEPATVGIKLVEGSKYSLAELAEYPTVNPAFTPVADKSGNGVYYYNYNNILAEGEKVVLFTNVIIPTDWDKAEINKLGAYKINLEAQAIQTDGFANAQEAFDALDAQAPSAATEAPTTGA